MKKKLLATEILLSLCMSGNDIKVANNFFFIILGARSANFLFFDYLLPWLTIGEIDRWERGEWDDDAEAAKVEEKFHKENFRVQSEMRDEILVSKSDFRV